MLVGGGLIAAILVGARRQLRELGFERLAQFQYARNSARAIDRLHQRIDLGQQPAERLDGLPRFGFGIGELLDVAAAKNIQAID